MQARAHGDGQADEERHQYGGDDPKAAQCEPQGQQHANDHRRHHQAGPVGQGGEFLVRQGHRPGQAHAHAVLRRQAQGACMGTQGVIGLLPRLQGVEVQFGLDLDEVADLLRPGRGAGDQGTPGQIFGLAVGRRLKHIGKLHHRHVEVAEFGISRAHPQKGVRKIGHKPPQRGVRRQTGQERLGLDQLRDGVLNLLEGKKQQSVLVKEGPAIGTADMAEQLGIGGQGLGQGRGGGFRQFRREAVYHHQGQVALLGKGGIELLLTHAPVHLGVDQLFAVGVHGEILLGVPGAGPRHQQAGCDHGPGPAAAKAHNAFDGRHGRVRAFLAGR